MHTKQYLNQSNKINEMFGEMMGSKDILFTKRLV